MHNYFLFVPLVFFTLFGTGKDLLLDKEFNMIIDENISTIEKNIDDELPMETNISSDLQLICLSSCRDDLATVFPKVTYVMKYKTKYVFKAGSPSRLCTYNRQ